MYEQWIAMEQFYYGYFAWGLLVVIILSILLVSCLYYVNLFIPKIILILTLIAFTIFGVGVVRGYLNTALGIVHQCGTFVHCMRAKSPPSAKIIVQLYNLLYTYFMYEFSYK